MLGAGVNTLDFSSYGSGVSVDLTLGAAAVGDQVCNGADFQAMFGSELLQVRQARHRAVVFHDFAYHRRRCIPSHGGQITTCLGVAGPHQHTAINGLQGKHMAGLHQIAGL